MNYEKIYNSLIQKRLTNKIDRSICYCEYHHIQPKSIRPELKDDPVNIVALTAKEHYVAHHLLVHWYKQLYGEKHAYYLKMLRAFLFTINIQNNQDKTKYVNARTYEFLKKEISKAKKGTLSWNSGKHGIYSDEYRKKISENHADVSGENNPMFGKHGKDNPNYGRHQSTDTKEKISKNQKLRYQNPKYKKLLQDLYTGTKWIHNPQTNKSIRVKISEVQKYLDNGFRLGLAKK